MAALTLIDFADIVDAVIEELHIQSSDTTAINRIKRDINTVYVNEVVGTKRWKWLEATTVINVPSVYSADDCDVTGGSTTVTLASAPDASLGSFTGYQFSIEGEAEVYTVASHTAGSATITLSFAYNGSTKEEAGFKIWKREFNLPVDCRETIEITHDFQIEPLEGRGLQEFRKIQQRSQKSEGRPIWYYTGDFEGSVDATRYRKLRVHPAIYTAATNLNVTYVEDVEPMELDGDEPKLPVNDRVILLYGVLARQYRKRQNAANADYYQAKFDRKLAEMLGKKEDTFDKASLNPDSIYMTSKRGPRAGRRSSSKLMIGTAGGGASADIKYLSGVTINGGSLTGNLTVTAGITIDGRDISVDGAALDAHIAASSAVHGITGSVVGTTDSQTLTNKTIDADSNTISNLAHGAEVDNPSSGVHGVTGSVVGTTDSQTLTNKTIDADSNTISNIDNNEIKAAAGINVNKLEALTASRAVATDASGFVSATSVTSTELGYVSGVTSAIQTQIDSKASATDLTTHTGASSGVHGVTGSVVGTTDTQTLTNKTIDADSNTISNIANAQIKAGAAIAGSKIDPDFGAQTIETTGDMIQAGMTMEALTSTTLTDNATTNVFTKTASTSTAIIVEYSLTRGTGNIEVGTLFVTNDGTNANVTGSSVDLGSLGVTFSADISTTDVRLRATLTSTGTNATMKFRIKVWTA